MKTGTILFIAIITIIFLFTTLILLSRFRISRIRKRQLNIFVELFKAQNLMPPTLEFGASYGWPTFTIIFNTKAEFETAKEKMVLQHFGQEMAEIYGDEFRREVAITCKFRDDSGKLQFTN